MSDRDGIPLDVWETAEAAATAPKAMGGLFSENYILPIAQAILAERKRCADSVREVLAYAGYSTDAGHGRAVVNAILAGSRP